MPAAWWIAFAPFVGLFLARVSRGRTIREFVLGAMLVPSLMCFLWFVIVGGTAIDLELNGGANRAIMDAGQSSQLFAMLSVMLSPAVFQIMTVIVVVLLLTYLVTSADSAEAWGAMRWGAGTSVRRISGRRRTRWRSSRARANCGDSRPGTVRLDITAMYAVPASEGARPRRRTDAVSPLPLGRAPPARGRR